MSNWATNKANFHHKEWELAQDAGKDKAAAYHQQEYLNYLELSKQGKGQGMKFYTTKYDYVTIWKYDKDTGNSPEKVIPQGTVMKVVSMDSMGLILEPISKDVDTGNVMMSFSPDMLKYGFTESDYID